MQNKYTLKSLKLQQSIRHFGFQNHITTLRHQIVISLVRDFGMGWFTRLELIFVTCVQSLSREMRRDSFHVG